MITFMVIGCCWVRLIVLGRHALIALTILQSTDNIASRRTIIPLFVPVINGLNPVAKISAF